MAKEPSLSASKLNVFNSCPRCFWLTENKKTARPRGIFPTLPGGMDGVIKTMFDKHRLAGTLPPGLEGDVSGVLYPDQGIMDKMRHWSTGLNCQVAGYKIIGALDDLILSVDYLHHSPFDYKTKGSEPKDDGSQYYQTQIDIYALNLRENDMKPSGVGYLNYYWPQEVLDNGRILFGSKVYKLEADPDRAIATITKAAKCLAGDIPAQAPGCEYCTLVGKVNSVTYTEAAV